MRPLVGLLLLAVAIRACFLTHPIQGDDGFYLAAAEHALVDPLHPHRFRLIAHGMEVDMRGFPHPPGNAWILAALLAIFGDVREPRFHAFYLLFSLGTVVSMWWLARRFSARPVEASLLFMATPAWVINGTSLESDLPFLAFWMAAVALWVSAVDSHRGTRLVLAVVCGAGAVMISFQGVVLAALWAVYLWQRDRTWIAAWVALLAPPVVLMGWQMAEWMSTGSLPWAVFHGYSQQRQYESLLNRTKNAAALTVHLGWMICPLLTVAAIRGKAWIAGAVCAAVAALVDPSPLFWLPFGIGVGILWFSVLRREFPARWLLVFFVSALVLFFAGSARYLLPLAAPLAILMANALRDWPGPLRIGAVLQLLLSLTLAFANFEHWAAYVNAASPAATGLGRRWVHADWGLRFYEESRGAIPALPGQALRPGDLLVTSRLAGTAVFQAGGGQLTKVYETAIQPVVPLRLLAPESRSGYSSAQRGQRAFEISSRPVDVISYFAVAERPATLSYLAMHAAEVDGHVISGLSSLEAGHWRWTAGRAVFMLRRPEAARRVEATFRIVDQAKGARVSLRVDGEQVAESIYPATGLYTLRSAKLLRPAGETVTVTLASDKPFRVPPDERELGVFLTGVGFRP
jgi:hypothetical protein